MRWIVAAGVAACLASAAPLQARDEALIVEPLNPFVIGPAAEPSVAATGNGFVVTWQARLDDGVTALRFAEIDTTGARLRSGEIARGSGWFVNWADFPSLAITPGGDWIAHWLQRSGPGYAYDIRLVRSRDGGASWSAPVALHDDGTRSEHGFVSLAAADRDEAIAVWLDGRNTQPVKPAGHDHGDDHTHGSGRMTLRAARVMGETIVDGVELDGSVCDCCQTDAARVGGATLVVYRGRSDDEIRDVRLIRHDGKGWQPSKPLFDDGWRIAGCPVNGPAIAAHGNDVIAAAYSEAGRQPVVRVRTSRDGGGEWSPAVTVMEGSTLGRLDAAALPGGRFLVARLDVAGDEAPLRVSLHDAEGGVIDTGELARLPAQRLSGFARMAASGDRILVAWTDPSGGTPQVRAAMLRAVRTSAGAHRPDSVPSAVSSR